MEYNALGGRGISNVERHSSGLAAEVIAVEGVTG